MLALMTVSKGRSLSEEEGGVGACCGEERCLSWARYFSERTASSPRTAYWACLILGFMLSIDSGGGAGAVVAILRVVCGL